MKQELLKALKTLKANGPIFPHSGICANLDAIFDDFFEFRITFHEIYKKWPKFSGSLVYPIAEHPEYYDNPFKWEGESGKLRWELVDFLIQQLENDLQTQ